MARALVTGATAGIGASIAAQLAGHGHDLIIVARDSERLAETSTQLSTQFKVDVETITADLSNAADRQRVVDVCAREPLTWLVNNAGFGVAEAFDRSSLADETRMLDVLVTAPMQLSHAALPGMLEREYGRILIVSSFASFIPSGSYAAAKAWATTFAESLSIRYKSRGVHTTAVCPGFTHTEFHERGGFNMNGVPEALWLDADAVAESGLRACSRGAAVDIPGIVYQGLHVATQALPRSVVRRLVSRMP